MNPIRGNSGVVKVPIKLTAQFMMCGSDKKEIRAGDMTAELNSDVLRIRTIYDPGAQQPGRTFDQAGNMTRLQQLIITRIRILITELYLQSWSYDEFRDDGTSRV